MISDHSPGAVLWDMDGTLVDTAELHFRAWDMLARERDLPFTRQDFNATFGWRNPEILRHLFGNRFDDAAIAEMGDQKEVYYRKAAGQGVDLLPGVHSLMNALHAGSFRQAIGSSAPRANLDLIIGLAKLDSYLQAVVAMEDVQRGKPDPQVFQLAASRLGLPPDRCVVVEDAVVGVQAAKAGGMKCIGVTFVGHHSSESLRNAGADLVVQSLLDVSVQKIAQLLA